ncbi:VCBS repeat-containing protein [Aquiflexum sp. TKW24L]|uniref:VCBS repeat-containing protein n=1 Tax=Aquiflexum sp. TKW24L TaxID=2942212 RepID=UPI0020BEA231|nr:VCBS repeat-containing protein [Aquiflexum sp. TKW24L]MCL6257736.1 VCBS repeat-containing protein [Aquiflexum sp. TKW24L]
MFFFIVFGFLSCSKPKEETLFKLLDPKETGIEFRNDLVSSEEMNILEYLYFYNGGGVATGDINNDGLVDIYFTSNQGENKLYLNKGNFKFEDITTSAAVTGDGGWSTGVTMADVNGDGFLDIYVTQVGDYKGLTGKNKLYINNGDLTFSEKGAAYGVDFVGFSTHSLFFDYDQDGDLDLYLLNHSIKKPEVFANADTKFTNQDEKGGDKLFKNLLAEGENRMVEVTEEAGILSSSLGFGLGVGIADINGDGWMDLYVSNDFTEDDYLYINQADGTFKESLQEYISNTSRYSMGNDLGDINNDGLTDIFTTDMLPSDPQIWMKSIGEDKQEVFDVKKRLGYKDQYVRNHLQLNRGDGRFSEIGLLTNTFATDWSWSPLIFDMDNDGQKDIHITNGIVKRPNDLDFVQYSQEPSPGLSEKEIQKKQIDMLPTVKLSNFSFRNEGGLKFTNTAKEWGLDQLSYSNGSAYADLDNDGDLDLVINNIDQEAFLYQNQTATKLKNHFIQFDLKGETLNFFGIGAQVIVHSGDKIMHQTLSTSRGFQSGTSTTLTFGLGAISVVDSVKVVWNATDTEVFRNIPINKRHLLEKGKGRKSSISIPVSTSILEIRDFGIDWTHEENIDFDDFRREYLIPRKYSTEGPALAVGDINGDGLEDIFFGGAKGQAGVFYLQQADGKFIKGNHPVFEQLKMAEDVVAVLEDFNQDGTLDLYIGSGGNESTRKEFFNFDRLFLNDGKGNFFFSMNSLPPISENTSTLAIHDINGDGAPDIFVGASVVTGNYGEIPKSYFLLNDGKGRFTEATTAYFGADFQPGMVKKAKWADLNNDGIKELILVGEWMAVQVYSQDKSGKFSLSKEESLQISGWYFGLEVMDIDRNGKEDIILGNLGLNSKLKANPEKPVWLYHGDFDENGQKDPLIFHYMEGHLVPFATRDDLIKQIPSIKGKHSKYVDFAKIQSPEDIFTETQLGKASKYQITELGSGILWNKGENGFQFSPFPVEAQFSPLHGFATFQTQKGKQYLLGIGNFHGFRSDYGKADAQPMVLMQFENGAWRSIPVGLAAMEFWGEFRNMSKIKVGKEDILVAVRNNNTPVFLKINP